MGIPARVISIDLSEEVSRPAVLRRNDGTEMTADLAMVPEARPGDYVVTHSGFAVSILTRKEARKVTELLDEMKEGETPTDSNVGTLPKEYQ